MKRQRHKRKASFSILLISNVEQGNKQFNISLFSFRLLVLLLPVTCIILTWLVCQYIFGLDAQDRLRSQLIAQQQQIEKLEAENSSLQIEKAALSAEIDLFRLNNGSSEGNEQLNTEPEADLNIPSLYPSSGKGILISPYSDDLPYISIGVQPGDDIITTGNGTVTSIGSDNTYPVIAEVSHESGYITRYMCRQEAELKSEEGAQISAGDSLFSITAPDTQVDYQIIFENEPIDPLTIIDAKG